MHPFFDFFAFQTGFRFEDTKTIFIIPGTSKWVTGQPVIYLIQVRQRTLGIQSYLSYLSDL